MKWSVFGESSIAKRSYSGYETELRLETGEDRLTLILARISSLEAFG
jgi:hypothetical protein